MCLLSAEQAALLRAWVFAWGHSVPGCWMLTRGRNATKAMCKPLGEYSHGVLRVLLPCLCPCVGGTVPLSVLGSTSEHAWMPTNPEQAAIPSGRGVSE